MDFPSIDIRMIFGFTLIALFWGAVIVQLITRKREIKQIRDTAKCTNCGHDDLEIDLFIVNIKSKRKVDLVKNIGGSLILLALAYVLLRGFVIVVIDLIADTNITGVQNESWIGKIGLWSFFLIVGLGCVIYSIPLLLDFFVGKKEKVVNLACNSCKAAYFLDRPLFQELAAKDALDQGKIGLIPLQPRPLTSTKPKEIPASPTMAKEKKEPCAKCGSLIETSDLTCPYCGHTQWGVIGVMGVMSLLIIGGVVLLSIKGNKAGLISWGGGILGAVLLMATVYSIVKAIQGPSSDSLESKPESDANIQKAELNPGTTSALPELQGILVISRQPMEQSAILNLTQQILDAQKAKGYAVAAEFEASHVAAGDDVDNEMFAYAKIRNLFSKLGAAEIVNRIKVFPLRFPGGDSGKYYVLYDRRHS